MFQAIENERKQQEDYDLSRREAILAEEKRIEEEDAEREHLEEEERRRQEEARIEAERLEAERIKAEKKQKKYEKWLAKMKKKNPGFVDPRIIKAQKAAAKAAAKAAKAKKKK
ncbi:hypothetical protein SELMODRAFT_172782 [Selaginella moellendorffii]|uniref:Uncharacterized protein n=1 Tax=Selaginella moellendorffii TaxID=88036 RepID=D8RMQ3_SELML|nr:hypothetical protein SELMODRAFT_172782 [Selaginella moellendorffii]